MLLYDDALNLEYYKKTSYTGWMGGMRFKIQKVEDEFQVWIWPGPYIFDLTPEEKKLQNHFPFTIEGRNQAVDWINEQYEANISIQKKKKTDEL